jgi:hypothetical protein
MASLVDDLEKERACGRRSKSSERRSPASREWRRSGGLDELALDIADERPMQIPGGLTDRIVAAYPARALHELLMNAVIHRNYDSTTPVMVNQYSDRIEILSPGGLARNGSPPATFDLRPNHVLAVVQKRP